MFVPGLCFPNALTSHLVFVGLISWHAYVGNSLLGLGSSAFGEGVLIVVPGLWVQLNEM